MKNLFFVYFTLLCSSTIFAQPLSQQWVSRYAGLLIDEAKMVKADNSGNVYVTGKSIGSGSGYDFLTVKYNSAGVQQWEARYNGPASASDEAVSLVIDNQGNVYVTGKSTGVATDYDYCLVKYNSSGMQQWAARFNDSTSNREDTPVAMVISDSGNVFITGYSYYTPGNYRWCTVKYNSSGIRQWINYFGGGGSYYDARDLAVDVSGNVYVTGQYWLPGSQITSTWMKKYNSAGSEVGSITYDYPYGYCDPYSLAIDTYGNSYVAARKFVTGQGYNICVMKFNSTLYGGPLWVNNYNGSANDTDYPRKVVVGATGDIYVSGFSKSTTGGKDITVIQYNGSTGAQNWVSIYNGQSNGRDEAFDLKLDPSGVNTYVTGYTDSAGTQNYVTMKFNYTGTRLWTMHYNGPSNGSDVANSIFLDNNYNVYITGLSYDAASLNDFATIKYSQLVGIQPVNNEIPQSYSLSQNYPNPFNPVTKIKFQIANQSYTRLVVYDMLGRVVETLVNENLNAGNYEVDYNALKHSSGIYFYRIEAEEFTETKKMILIK